MDGRKRFDEALLPKKEDFYSILNMKISQVLIMDMQKQYLKTLIKKI